VLPVEGGLESTWGNGLDQLRLLNAHNVYNAILISPQFDKDPWYCDHPTDLGMRHETFMCTDLRAWIQATYTPAKHHIIGFSKSGTGPMTMILRNPTLFDKISTWDSPFDMDSYSDFGGSSENAYGTEANFQNNYQLTAAHLESWKTAFLATNRLWISGFHVFQQDTIDFDSALTGKAMLHTFFTQIDRTHAWDSGWLPDALTGLFGAGGGSTIPLGTQRLLPQFSRM
jgi:S-formylglutathione hydrolase FrmB